MHAESLPPSAPFAHRRVMVPVVVSVMAPVMTPEVLEAAATSFAETTVLPAFAQNVQIGSQPIQRRSRMLGAIKFSSRGFPHKMLGVGTDLMHDGRRVFERSETTSSLGGSL